MVEATLVAWLERRLTVVDISIVAAAPADGERDHRLGLPAALSAGTVLIDRFCYEGLGQARRVLRFTYPGVTGGMDDAPPSLRCLWQHHHAVDMLATVAASDAEPFLKALPTVDALLDTPPGVPGTGSCHESPRGPWAASAIRDPSLRQRTMPPRRLRGPAPGTGALRWAGPASCLRCGTQGLATPSPASHSE